MASRLLRCNIEEVADWHAHLYVEPHVVAFVAVVGEYSSAPARFDVQCSNIVSRWLGTSAECLLEVSWRGDYAEKAGRLRATMQAAPLVELASVALALILASRVVPLGRLLVTDRGDRADYRARKRKVVLEVSGTENAAELERRHREKVRRRWRTRSDGKPTWSSVRFPRRGIASASADIRPRRRSMAKAKPRPAVTLVEELMTEASATLSKAQAFTAMGMGQTAQPLWASAAALQERIAPLLDAGGEAREAAVYRMSSASCYEKAGDPSRATNLYQAALAGPLRPVTRKEVEGMLAACLARLKAESVSRRARGVASAS